MYEDINKSFEGEDTLSMDKFSRESDIYPDAKLNISRETASVFQMKRRWERNPSMLDLCPSFQREDVWSSKKRCELIESILMGIPIPAFYVRENEDGVHVVVDGKQRFTTLFNFIDGKFRLDKLTILKSYNTLYFSDLTPTEQNKIEDYTIWLNVIKAPTSDRVIFDLFDRVNRGGERLNNQEMRNALYQGNSTELINELAKFTGFISATENAATPKHMKDRYLVLRFLAFYVLNEEMNLGTERNVKYLQYKSNIEDFLGSFMRLLNSLEPTSPILDKLRKVFYRVMDLANATVKNLGGFRLPPNEDGHKRPINMAFFESFCYLLAKIKDSTPCHITKVYNELLSNEKYISSLTHSVDSIRQINTRYNCVKEYL